MSSPSARPSCSPEPDSGSSSSSRSSSPGWRGTQRRVLPAREVVGEQAGAAEAVGDRAARRAARSPSRRDPEPLERLDERRSLSAAAQQLDGMGRDRRRRRSLRGAGRVRRRRRRARRSASGPGRSAGPPAPGAGARSPARRGSPRRASARPGRRAAARGHAVEVRLARSQRLDRRAEALQPRDRALPRLGDAHRIGRHERQARAARQRLPHPHPRVDAVRLGGLRDGADEELAPGLGCQRRGFAEQPRPAARGDGELESLEQDADNRHRTDVRNDSGWAQARWLAYMRLPRGLPAVMSSGV